MPPHPHGAAAPATPAAPRGGLLTSRSIGWAGVLLSLLMVGSLLGVLSYQRSGDLQHASERNKLLARVLEDHASRTLDAAVLATATLAQTMLREEDLQPSQLALRVRQLLSNQAALRALAVLAADGQVLAAAGTVETGTRVDLARLGPLPASGSEALGPYLAGRGLPLVTQERTAPPGLGVLPYLRNVRRADGQTWWIIAVLNPDTFASFQEQTLRDPTRSAALVGYDGQVMAATSSAQLAAQQTLGALPPLRQFLPEREHGDWTGAGLAPGERLAAFRALRRYPLFVVVDLDRSAVTQETVVRTRWFAATGVGAIALVLVLSQLAARAQRAREEARQALDAAQAELAARGRELSVVFSSVRELMFRTDATGAVQLMNARWELTTGRPLAQALGQPLASLVSPASRAQAAALFEVDPDGAPKHAEVFIEGPEGHICRFDMTVVPLFEPRGLVGFAGSAVDMTELLATQQELRTQLAFSASLIESNPLPIVVLDNLNRYLRVNRAWETFTGRSRDRVVGTLASLAHAPELARLHDAKDARLREQGGELNYEAQARRADGSLRDVYVSKALIRGSDGQPAAIVGAFMDISEFREAERATRQARDAAERASSAKSEFIANISHELRTPLQSILGFSELGSRRSEALPRTAAMFDDIHRSGQRMLALVNDLLDLSKLERPGLTLELMRMDVRDLLREVCAELAPLALAKQLELVQDYSPEPLVASVDGVRLQQVVRNLLANAIRFSPAQRSVELHAVAAARGEGEIVLSVIDQGPGVPRGELEAIFDPFVQSSRTKTKAGGTGLGLAISRRIVQAHAGRIEVSHTPAGGAVFTVTLPAARFGDTRPAVGV